MFATLRPQPSGGKDYTLQPILEDVTQPRQARSNHSACDRCKAKKLRCTGERSGCQRCEDKRVDCSYSLGHNYSKRITTASGSGAERNGEHETSALSSSSSSTTTTIMGMGRRPAEADTDPFSGGIFNLNESFSDRIGDYLLGSPNLSLPVADETFSLHPFPVAAPLSTTNQETRASNGHEAAEGYDMGISEQVSATCSCSSQIVVTFEMVEISLHLVTAPKGSPGRPSQAAAMNIEEFLRDHKRALVSCEMLLGCETCSCRGEYVMLVISICRKLLHSVGVMHREGLSEVQNRDSSRERGGLWKLDDEDQAGVLEVLLKIRATRLRRLVTILDHVVTSHDWPAHRSMTQDLVRRLAEA